METPPDARGHLRRTRAAVVFVVAVVAAGWTSFTRADAPAGRYAATAGAVSDSKTGLTWQQAAAPPMEVSDATAYCSALDLNGMGWRLPTVKELLTLVDDTRSMPAIDPIFACGPHEIDLSTTILARLAQYATAYYVVVFSDGHSEYGDIAGVSVRCVRDAGAR